MNVSVRLVGCDDVTQFNIDCTAEEAAFLRMVARLSEEASSYICEPRMAVDEASIEDDS